MITIERSSWKPSEIAAMLGVSKTTVNAWIDKGILPAVKIGKVRRVPKVWYEEWLESRKVA